jgi:hypothetical protein
MLGGPYVARGPTLAQPCTRVSLLVRTDNEVLRYLHKGVSLSVRTGSLYQYKEVGWVGVSLSVQCADKFCTDSELDKGVSLLVVYR